MARACRSALRRGAIGTAGVLLALALLVGCRTTVPGRVAREVVSPEGAAPGTPVVEYVQGECAAVIPWRLGEGGRFEMPFTSQDLLDWAEETAEREHYGHPVSLRVVYFAGQGQRERSVWIRPITLQNIDAAHIVYECADWVVLGCERAGDAPVGGE